MGIGIGQSGHGRRLVSKAHILAPVPGMASGGRPKVSVIIPCFNYERFLPGSVGSALSQDGVETEVIIVDDASTDHSADIAERYARQDPRVTVIRHGSNVGHIDTFNDGLAAATGEFIVRLDADDLLTPGSLARAVALLDAFPSVGLVYGHPKHFTTGMPPSACTRIRGWRVWSGEEWVADRCRKGANCITTPEVMVRGSVMLSVGGLSTRLHLAEDMEMWLRVAAVSDVGRVEGPDQAFHRDHPASMTAAIDQLTDLRARANVFDVLFAGPERPAVLRIRAAQVGAPGSRSRGIGTCLSRLRPGTHQHGRCGALRRVCARYISGGAVTYPVACSTTTDKGRSAHRPSHACLHHECDLAANPVEVVLPQVEADRRVGHAPLLIPGDPDRQRGFGGPQYARQAQLPRCWHSGRRRPRSMFSSARPVRTWCGRLRRHR